MDTSSVTQSVLSAVQSAEPTESARAGLQVALLKKTLQMQQDQAAEIQRLLEGKGQHLDLRV